MPAERTYYSLGQNGSSQTVATMQRIAPCLVNISLSATAFVYGAAKTLKDELPVIDVQSLLKVSAGKMSVLLYRKKDSPRKRTQFGSVLPHPSSCRNETFAVPVDNMKGPEVADSCWEVFDSLMQVAHLLSVSYSLCSFPP